MKPSQRIGFILLMVVILSFVGPQYLASVVTLTEGHLLNQPCQECHLAQGTVQGEQAAVLLTTQEQLCVRCHADAVRLSHPSGFTPGRVLPGYFPLDWKGDLTCSTCHRIHGQEPGLLKSGNRGFEFCLECHDQAFFDQMPDRGDSMVISGHLDARSKGSADFDLDTFSQQCMTCHNETQAGLVTISSDGVARHQGGTGSHPIGVLYEQSRDFGGYKAKSQLPETVVLPDGKLSCVSCHQGYSSRHGGLVVSNQGSALCMTCHEL